MAPVTGTLQSGSYTISNVPSHKYATLKDANGGSNVIGTNSSDSDDVKWTVDKLSNDHYTVMSYKWATYASVSAAPKAGDPIEARSLSYQWTIRETSTKGVYLLYPNSDNSVYWSLANGNDNTRVTLTSTDDDKMKWQFTRVNA